jgi:hypothetical protein
VRRDHCSDRGYQFRAACQYLPLNRKPLVFTPKSSKLIVFIGKRASVSRLISFTISVERRYSGSSLKPPRSVCFKDRKFTRSNVRCKNTIYP